MLALNAPMQMPAAVAPLQMLALTSASSAGPGAMVADAPGAGGDALEMAQVQATQSTATPAMLPQSAPRAPGQTDLSDNKSSDSDTSSDSKPNSDSDSDSKPNSDSDSDGDDEKDGAAPNDEEKSDADENDYKAAFEDAGVEINILRTKSCGSHGGKLRLEGSGPHAHEGCCAVRE